MIVCIFEDVQWRWELNDKLALGYKAPEAAAAVAAVGGRLARGCVVVRA